MLMRPGAAHLTPNCLTVSVVNNECVYERETEDDEEGETGAMFRIA